VIVVGTKAKPENTMVFGAAVVVCPET